MDRFAEHFHNVLNWPSIVSDEAIAHLPPVPIDICLAEPASYMEVEEAMRRMFGGKAPGSDSIPAEVYAPGGSLLIGKLIEMYQTMGNQENNPQEFEDALLFTSTIGKGTDESAIITETSLCFPLEGKYWPGSCWTSKSTPQARLAARESVWILSRPWNSKYGICCMAVAKEVSRLECQSLNYLCWPDQGIWHCQSWWGVENHAQVWFYWQVHDFGQTVPWWYACQSARW